MFPIMNTKYMEKSAHYWISLRCSFIIVNKDFVIICPDIHSAVIRSRELAEGNFAKGVAVWSWYIKLILAVFQTVSSVVDFS